MESHFLRTETQICQSLCRPSQECLFSESALDTSTPALDTSIPALDTSIPALDTTIPANMFFNEKVVLLSEDNYLGYSSQISALLTEHGHNPSSDINLNRKTYIYIENNVILAYCVFNETKALHDKKCKYIRNKFLDFKKKGIKGLKFANDFGIKPIVCLYNLIRKKGSEYVGSGIRFIKLLLKEDICKNGIYLACINDRLYKYYISNGFKPTDYFDLDTEGIPRKILLLAHASAFSREVKH
jgi:hypothetical protein